VYAEDETVQKDDVRAARVEVVCGEQVQVLHSQIEAEAPDGPLLVVRRHVRGERQVLDQAARLALGRIGGAEHTPLAGLERARARDLARLFELRHDARHHTECRNEREPRQHLQRNRNCMLHI